MLLLCFILAILLRILAISSKQKRKDQQFLFEGQGIVTFGDQGFNSKGPLWKHPTAVLLQYSTTASI